MREFRNWFEAYDYCREADCPVTVRVTTGKEDQTVKLFPSGTCKVITDHLTPPPA